MRALVLVVCGGCASVLGLDGYRARDRDGGATDAGASDAATDTSCLAAEACTPPSAEIRAVDEDCDGAIDEACVWAVARPHAMTATQVAPVVGSPWLSPDGLRFYFVNRTDGTLWMTSRRSARDPFEQAQPIDFASPSARLFNTAWLTENELEIVIDAGEGIERGLFFSNRTAREDPFSDWIPLPLNRPGLDAAPVLSADGSELFFVSDRTDGVSRIHLSLRDGMGAFSAAAPLVLDDAFTWTDSPAISVDGRTLFFRGSRATDGELYYATRAALRSPMFRTPTPVNVPEALAGTDYNFFLGERTGELFFVSDRPWSPGVASLWRTRLCRSDSCTIEPVQCTEGVPSGDLQHCYFSPSGSGLVTWEDARAACAALTDSGSTTHLATVHSAEEAVAARDARGMTWLGAREMADAVAWITGEPEPRGLLPAPALAEIECAAIRGGGLWPEPYALVSCTEAHPFVCEREAWPIW